MPPPAALVNVVSSDDDMASVPNVEEPLVLDTTLRL